MWEMIIKGGPLMFLIILCSVVAFAVVLERLWHLHRARIDTRGFMETIAGILKRNKILDAIDMCNVTPGPIAHILKAGILKHDRSRLEIKEAIEDAGLHEVPRLEKNLGVLATIAHITPLLGLLGTVTGMVKAFQVIEQKATALVPVNPGDLAGGIWEALITTVAGLAVAIPTYVAYNFLVSKADGFVLEMEKSATDLVNILGSKRDEDEV
ncbi:MAG: MotA/TolQ/ExbB proton channel family protein [Candidatus Omnitrophica bacterium]|nr:MotA/TolQ/ExbB proton channel family protein [Candidatus Omnitrophota bacterium]MBU1127500.1 MotA/TolQ/ExbB proton channel family protein [Candidatus Omnitrophota bacterium]MBU1785124.1 MotA/TolQ/ExbB proton channel family protein [Candidatus Omnitrophota bacterium]MBU1851517.1 MotA/TolQ/ExbB proton channel family protein [Candidatus Omnitrophota bacterium]